LVTFFAVIIPPVSGDYNPVPCPNPQKIASDLKTLVLSRFWVPVFAVRVVPADGPTSFFCVKEPLVAIVDF
jgi:hypothetical protein